jgi:hypothetical protein
MLGSYQESKPITSKVEGYLNYVKADIASRLKFEINLLKGVSYRE